MTELTDEAVKSLAHKYRFAKDDNERTIAKTAEALLDARAERDRLRADAQAAAALVAEQAAGIVRSVWGRCEALEDEAAEKLDNPEKLTEYEQGFWRGQKMAAKSIRRSIEMPLAPADGLAAVEALRKERDSLKAFIENDADWEFSAKRRLQLFREMRAERDRLAVELAAAQQREAALVDALTPSGDTKAAYMGEIKDPDTKRMVSWTAIKMVMAMVSARAALSNNGRTGDLPDAVDPPCTDCDDTGITHQTERFCSCGAGIAAAHNGRGE